ncbi:MAG TPA: hypothetical protein VGO73_06160, partial [Pyrinomonadaceae bacterium]|nr:hypothetical protein [Pyrinomonadaceae bacterium]
MPARYPPEEDSQTGRRFKKDPRSRSRIVAYAEPEVSWKRRIAHRLISPPVIIPVLFVATLVVGFLVYYWTVFSGRIDNLLKGDVFTRSAGIYAAPKQLRVGQTLTPERLIDFLKHAGYVEKSQQADKARGRYLVGDATVDVEPSENITVDGQRQFQSVRVQFSRNGKSITSLTELETSSRLDKAWLEPELISS